MVSGLSRKLEVENQISVSRTVELIILIVIEGIRNYALELLCTYLIRGLGIRHVHATLYMLYWTAKNMAMPWGLVMNFYFMINYLYYIPVYFYEWAFYNFKCLIKMDNSFLIWLKLHTCRQVLLILNVTF